MNKVILLTGFEPFGHYSFNPTMDIVKELNGKFFTTEGNNDFLKARKIVGEVLPATYDAFDHLVPLIDKYKPYAIVGLGFASSASGFHFELGFHNRMGGFKYPDANGYNPEKQIPIMEGNDTFFKANTDFSVFVDKFMFNNIRFCTSFSAGHFICNTLGYKIANKIKNENLETKQVFFHLPCTLDYKEQVKFNPADGKIFLDKKVIFEGLKIVFKNI